MDSARGCPPGVSPLPPRYRRDGGKRRKERRDRKGGGRKGARKEEEEEKEESLQTGAFLVGPLLRFASSPPLVALKQWAYISWAAHACEIVLIYRWAITRSHILGSRLHVGLAAQLSCRRETKRSRRKGEKIGGGRWDQPRFERGGGGGGGLLPRDSRAEFISIRGGACSDNASVAFHPSSSDTHPSNFDFSLIETNVFEF